MEHKGGGSSTSVETRAPCLSNFVDEGSTESRRYYLARRTVLEMLRDRGYVVPSSDIKMSLQDFRDKHTPQLDFHNLRVDALHCTDSSKRIQAIFCGPDVLKVNIIRGILMQANTEGVSGLILILQSDITSQALKAAESLPLKVEIFQITDFLVNITKHVLKPKHQILTDEEKQRLLKKYNIEEKQLPRMTQKDAMARYYGLRRGQVVKITYSGEEIGLHITYRCVW